MCWYNFPNLRTEISNALRTMINSSQELIEKEKVDIDGEKGAQIIVVAKKIIT